MSIQALLQAKLSDPEMIVQLQRFPTSLGWSSTGNVCAAAGPAHPGDQRPAAGA